MAKINPRDITIQTECYAAVEAEIGFQCGRIKGWKLYSLENPAIYRTLNQRPSEILAAFTTREELEQWRREVCGEPEPKKSTQPTLVDNVPEPKKSGQASLCDLPDEQSEEVKLKTVGSGTNKLIISSIL